MDVPLKIVEKGGKTLRRYIEIKKKLDEYEIDLNTTDANITLTMVNIDKLIGNYLPEKEPYTYNHLYDDYQTRKIIANIYRDGNKVLNNIYGVEEYLKQLKNFIIR